MAKNDHCSVCDYTEGAGASSLGVRPGQFGRVRRHGNDLLCDDCFGSIEQNFIDLTRDDEDDEHD